MAVMAIGGLLIIVGVLLVCWVLSLPWPCDRRKAAAVLLLGAALVAGSWLIPGEIGGPLRFGS
jgi:hypothetical protein